MSSTPSGRMNRLLVLGLLLICCHARVIEVNDPLTLDAQASNKVVKFLEDFREKMRTGDESLGIPVLDPFFESKMPIEINEDIISLDALLTNLNVNKLSEYEVLSGNFGIIGLKFNMNLSWPLISANTNYSMTGNIDTFQIYGKGKIDMSAYNLVFGTEIRFKVNGVYLKVKTVTSTVSLKKLDFVATGLFNDEETSEVISSVISSVVPDLIDDYQDVITEKINALITKELDVFLADKTISDLIKMFG